MFATTRKLACSAAISLTILASMVGCTQQSVSAVLANIQSKIPVAEGFVNTLAPLVASLDPAIAPEVVAGQAIVTAGLTELSALITTYNSNPSASVLSQIQTLISNLATQGSASLLAALKISNPTLKNEITVALGGLSTILLLIEGQIQGTESAAQIKTTAAARTVKLSQLQPYLDKKMVETATGVPFQVAIDHQQALGF